MCEAPAHDGERAYNAHRCRCPAARDAHARDEKRRRYDAARGIYRSLPAVGTVRRLQALAAVGWPAYELAARLGHTSGESLLNITRRERVERRTAEKITALYDELSMLPGPSPTTRRRAAAKGWPPPLAWPDESIDNPAATPQPWLVEAAVEPDPIAVERVLAGEQLPLWPADRLEIARRIVQRGGGSAEISQVLRMNGTYARRLVEQVAS